MLMCWKIAHTVVNIRNYTRNLSKYKISISTSGYSPEQLFLIKSVDKEYERNFDIHISMPKEVLKQYQSLKRVLYCS